jgi:hypothetical protein
MGEDFACLSCQIPQIRFVPSIRNPRYRPIALPEEAAKSVEFNIEKKRGAEFGPVTFSIAL